MTLQPFEKWEIDFVGPIQHQGKKTGARDHGTHFLKETINALTKKFELYHLKSMASQPQANEIVQSFNKALENPVTKVFNAHRSDWDLCIPVVLWVYQTTCKKFTRQTPFMIVYVVEALMPMEYIVPSLRITTLMGMKNREALKERLAQLAELQE
eukprot:PITA_20778